MLLSVYPLSTDLSIGDRGVQLGFQVDFFFGDRMGEIQGFGTKLLAGVAEALSFGISVLWVTQDGESHVGAVESQLMGSAGDGF